jgi:hypothetical protein
VESGWMPTPTPPGEGGGGTQSRWMLLEGQWQQGFSATRTAGLMVQAPGSGCEHSMDVCWWHMGLFGINLGHVQWGPAGTPSSGTCGSGGALGKDPVGLGTLWPSWPMRLSHMNTQAAGEQGGARSCRGMLEHQPAAISRGQDQPCTEEMVVMAPVGEGMSPATGQAGGSCNHPQAGSTR